MSGPAVTRRSVLIGAAALAALGAGAACGSPPPAQTDDLKAQLDLAHRDSQMATAAAAAAGAFYAPLLNVVADERAAHAKALSGEIARATGASVASSTPPAPTASAGAAPPPSRDDVIAALHESADSAGRLAVNSSGYRAGLLGSIAASCTTSATVPLALRAPTS